MWCFYNWPSKCSASIIGLKFGMSVGMHWPTLKRNNRSVYNRLHKNGMKRDTPAYTNTNCSNANAYIFNKEEEELKEWRVMTTFRRFCCNDLLRFASVNLDHITDTVSLEFYMGYLIHWPNYFQVAVAPGNRIMGYFIGRVIGEGLNWHGHVTALTVAPEYRRRELATLFLHMFEEHMCEKMFFSPSNHPYSVNLFVSVTNIPAIKFCEKLGYVIYQQVLGYFSEDEDAYDMTKSLEKDYLSMRMTSNRVQMDYN